MSNTRLRFVFLSPGYPGAPSAASAGGGVGSYTREMALGLGEAGHQCHVLTWGRGDSAGEDEVEGVAVHTHAGGHWPVLERYVPDGRRAWSRGRAAAALDRRLRFDWAEIQSSEGIDIAAQRYFGERAVVRVHTTLKQMCASKGDPPTPRRAAYLAREHRSLARARRAVTHSAAHAAALRVDHPELKCPVKVVPHGTGVPAALPPLPAGRPRFLIVGTLDRRKGIDRLAGVLAAFRAAHGPCDAVVVTPEPAGRLAEFGAGPPYPPGVSVTARGGLSDADLRAEYGRATALLHLARYESFGLPLIEAAAAGTPAVATPTGVGPGPAGRRPNSPPCSWAATTRARSPRRSPPRPATGRRWGPPLTAPIASGSPAAAWSRTT